MGPTRLFYFAPSLVFSLHVSRVLVWQILGKTTWSDLLHVEAAAYISHWDVSEQSLSSLSPSVSSPSLSLFLFLSVSLSACDSDQPGLMTTGMQFAVFSTGSIRKATWLCWGISSLSFIRSEILVVTTLPSGENIEDITVNIHQSARRNKWRINEKHYMFVYTKPSEVPHKVKSLQLYLNLNVLMSVH